MARRIRSSSLETRTSRLRLPPRRKPHFQTISSGIAIGYRRNANGAGSWSVRAAAGDGSNWLKKIGIADDHETADGRVVLDFWQACDKARELARADDGQASDSRPATISEALDAYEHDLRSRGANTDNVSRIRHNLPSAMAAQLVSQVTPRELRGWRDRMMKTMTPASADRTARVLSAALSLAGRDDARITNGSAWKSGLKRLPDSERARPNVVLPDDVIRDIVVTAHGIELEFGLLIELLAVTGARTSQVLRLKIGDLEDGGAAPRLQMPTSRKGRNRKVEHKALPITPTLAVALRAVAAGRPDSDPLLVRHDGRAWPWQIRVLFQQVIAKLGLDPTLTAYALRHSSVTRALKGGTPLQLTASSHDTSAEIVARHYAKFIVDNSDTLLRRTMLDMETPTPDNVLKLPAGRKP